jgi:protein PhnA
MSDLPPCPKCNSSYAYEDPSGLLVCPECGNEWSPTSATPDVPNESPAETEIAVRDAVGNILQDGDTVVLIKDLKVKGSPTGLKAGTKVKKIRLVDGDHNIDCRVEGIGQMGLKSEFVKKA